MVEIRLHNTGTRRKEVLAPIDPTNVRMYVCGPTVYDRAHLGNARSVVVFDVLYRLLRHVYGKRHVRYVRNFTDIDDKINARARASGRRIDEITAETTRWYLDDMGELGVLELEPDAMPRATAFIPQMVAMIAGLIAGGHAYEAEGHVLFRVRSYEGYGALSGRSVDDMIAGARVEVAPCKEDPMDFVLWKPSTPDLPGWDSPWGRGRPGWHIECSTMSHALLGESFDIHGGGSDLLFPHHENEVAQSRCACPHGEFARIWMHNEMLRVGGQKMSKSLGNFLTVRELLDQDVPAEAIRFVLLSTHYRKPMDWTAEKVKKAKETLRKWAGAANAGDAGSIDDLMLKALAEDLNTSRAMDRLDDLFNRDKRADLARSAMLLGFDLNVIASSDWAKPFHYMAPDGQRCAEGVDYMPGAGVIGWGGISNELRDASVKLVHVWLSYRRNRDWENADLLKNKAALLGVELRASGSRNGLNQGMASLENGKLDLAKLVALIDRGVQP